MAGLHRWRVVVVSPRSAYLGRRLSQAALWIVGVHDGAGWCARVLCLALYRGFDLSDPRYTVYRVLDGWVPLHIRHRTGRGLSVNNS